MVCVCVQEEAKAMMERVIYLPVHRLVPQKDLRRMATIIKHVLDRMHGATSSSSSAGAGGAAAQPLQLKSSL